MENGKKIKSFIRTTIRESLNENKKIVDDFLDHYYKGIGLNMNNIPKFLINKFPDFKITDEPDNWNSPADPISYSHKLDKNQKLYAGVERDRKITDIQSWTLDEETAEAFSKKYENGKVVELSYGDFIKYFNYFVSIDVIYDYIYRNGLNNETTDDYVSETEIVIL